jgi:signal transduction histidine kinase
VRRERTVAIATVVGVVAISALAGDQGAWPVGAVAILASGLFAAVAVFSLFAYGERRDPALLLVGVGTATLAVHRVVIDALSRSAWEWSWTREWFGDVITYSTLAGLLILSASLVAVIPWVDRRGRPPMEPGRVVLASIVGIVALDVLAATLGSSDTASDGLPLLGWVEAGALVLAGIVAAVRAEGWAGRFAWIAAAGLSLAIHGSTPMLATWVDGQRAQIAVSNVATITPALTAAFLVTFVVTSLQLESTRTRRASDRAEEVLTGRAEIAAMVAHDVRGPLGTMKGLATTVRKSYDRLGDEERLEFIGMIERESTRLLTLVEHIALALRVDAGTLDLTIRPRSLGPLVRHAIELRDLASHPLDVDVTEDVLAPVDAKWLPVAIGEAIDNAARFSPPDAPISVRLLIEAGRAVIAVEDRGPGVPSERRDEVFTRFARWRPPGYEDRTGSGLGLFICRGIARVHGGDASIVDAPGGGTILRIELPMEGTGSG